MKGKLKILLLPAVALSLGAIAIEATRSVVMTSAATFLDTSVVDDFASGIDSEKYDVVGDSGSKFNFVDKKGSVTFGGFDYNVGWLRTKNKVALATGKSLVIEFRADELPNAWLCIGARSDSIGGSWGDMFMINFAGNMVFRAGVNVPKNMEGTATQWIGTNTYINGGFYRFVLNDDGSAEIYGSLDGTTFTELCYFDAGVFKNSGDGYVSFMGNGLTGEATIGGVKIGVADDKNLTNLAYSIEENFDGDENAFVFDETYAVNNSHCTFNKPAKYLVANSPASGAAIVTKNSYSFQEGTNKAFEATAKLTLDSLGEKAIGLASGIADSASPLAGNFFGVKKTATGYGLTLTVGGTEKATLDLGSDSLDGQTVELKSYIKSEDGKYVVYGEYGDKIISAETTYSSGKIAIALSGEGDTTAKIAKLTINDYKGVSETGRDLKIDFSNGIDHNWTVKSTNNAAEAEDGHVYVTDDGMLRFENAGDGSCFSTNYKYANFDLTFKAKKQQFEEDDDGNVTQASSWLGVSIGKEENDSFFGNDGYLIYLNVDTVDSLPAVDRGWCTKDQLMLDESNEGVMFNVHIQAKDGTIKTWLTNPASTEDPNKPILTRYDIDTAGYLSFCSTAGGNFWIDDIVLKNLDGNQVNNNAPVAKDYTEDVKAGETLSSKVEATDADEGEKLTYSVVEDKTSSKGTLTFKEDGTYTFKANDDAEGAVTFTYKAFDTEDYSETKTVTINIEKKAVEPEPASSEEASSEEKPASSEKSASETASTSSDASKPDEGKKGGCGGEIIGTSLVALAALAGVGVIALKRRKDDK